jgi:hypothetical protein
LAVAIAGIADGGRRVTVRIAAVYSYSCEERPLSTDVGARAEAAEVNGGQQFSIVSLMSGADSSVCVFSHIKDRLNPQAR